MMILPATLSDVGSMISLAMNVIRQRKAGTARRRRPGSDSFSEDCRTSESFPRRIQPSDNCRFSPCYYAPVKIEELSESYLPIFGKAMDFSATMIRIAPRGVVSGSCSVDYCWQEGQ